MSFPSPPLAWSAWSLSACSVSCGPGGTRTNSRACRNHLGSKVPDAQCGAGDSTQTLACAPQAECPVPGAWGAWGQCSITCGDGVRTRQR